jgi:hypothetical protein
MNTIKGLQAAVAEHIQAELQRPHDPILRAQAELGSIAEAYQNMEAGEYGSPEHHLNNMVQAAAEVVLALTEFCARQELDLQDAVEHVWHKRRMKRWRENPAGPAPTLSNQ